MNLRGTLAVIKAAAAARDHHGLSRMTDISTVAVCGIRDGGTIREDEAIDWQRADFDPYARTKRFCEHLCRELLHDVPLVICRPSIVLGDSRREATTQFDMVRAFAFFAGLPVLPFRPDDRVDIVPSDFVADAVVHLHLAERPAHETYHLSAGDGSETFRTIRNALATRRGRTTAPFAPWLQRPFEGLVRRLSSSRGTAVGRQMALLRVFLPYLTWNTVFDNSRIQAELGRAPERFSNYCHPLLEFSQRHKFAYPYREWPRAASI